MSGRDEMAGDSSAGGGEARAGHETGGDGGRDTVQPPHAGIAHADLLAYMADMLTELKALADQGGQRTLSGLLALAHVEATARCHELDPGEPRARRSGGS